MAHVGSSPGASALLDECRAIDGEIDAIDRNLAQLQQLQVQTLSDAAGSGPASRQLEDLSADTMDRYRTLTPRVRALKSNPAAGQQRNAGQVARVDRRLKDAIGSYQSVESSFQRDLQDQLARQYRIVRPDADEEEVRGAVEDTRGEIFQRALLQSGKQGQASAALSAVKDRHGEIKKIERQMAELAQLFQDVNAAVVMQEADVARIEDQGEQAVQNLEDGNRQVEKATDSARAAKKKKWICLGIVGEFSPRGVVRYGGWRAGC
ncbi:hypothetical protein IMZ48_46710 [Candidatus Bathyarchaeota archaeon]|nr:hypothetical protein [Candidatus Bathyarchaeota archaeon]